MRPICFLLFLIGNAYFTVFAQSISDIKDLDWETCMREATIGNPDLSIARAELEKSVFENRKAYANFVPQINAIGSFRRSENLLQNSTSNNTDPLVAAIRNNQNSTNNSGNNLNNQDPSVLRIGENTGPFDRFSIGLSADQNLFAGLKDVGELDRTSSIVRVNQKILEDTKLRVSFELSSAFSQTLYAQALMDLSKIIYDRRIMNRNMVKLRYEGGREHKGSYLLSEAAVGQAKFELEQAERLWQTNSAELFRVMGRDYNKPIRVIGALETPTPPNRPNMTKIAETHPQVQQEQARVKAAQAGINIADSQFYPSLGWNASVSQQDEKWLPNPRSYSIGVSVTYPLFAGGRDYYNSKIARKEMERTRHQLQKTKNQLTATLEQTFQNFITTSDNVAVLANFFEAAETRAKIARAQYSNGLLPFENWDIIESDLIQRQRSLLAGRRDAKIAEANWLRNSGQNLLP
ncbi:TolC family protein [Leptospira sp. GIMC2001]|uniref:TolC family protein n=1 Tax=Leptospira sp. GIMC2001 TaxID=1513297 RepID=UPI00234AD015|nr:TolC family protein [Leptospira sp. GIMC2001]WCL49013.1 TolC family protein [Leptospira sp. GIMC2001]